MSEWLEEIHTRLAERYASGEVPWDDTLPPPEVMENVNLLTPGKAVDLGCGYGRASIYLASKGWQVDAVDFVEQALEEARLRTAAAGLSVHYHLGSVTDLSFLQGPYDFALDVGCAHVLNEEGLRIYQVQLRNLLAPGATYLLFARCEGTLNGDDEPKPGLSEDTLLAIFEDAFTLEWAERSQTHMSDGQSWPSAWYRFRRRTSPA